MSSTGSRGSRGVQTLLKRLFSSSGAPALPPQVQALLEAAPAVQVAQLPGQGRGLVARRDVQLGERLFAEQPFLCVPAASKRRLSVCYHCLRVLPSEQQQLTRSHAFCSPDCLAAARSSYYSLEASADLTQLTAFCDAQGERFPLLAARLALMVAQQVMMAPAAGPHGASGAGAAAAAPTKAGGGGGGGGGLVRVSRLSMSMSRSSVGSLGRSSSNSSSSTARGASIGRLSTVSSAGAGAAAAREVDNPSAALSFLCFANVPRPPPAPWQTTHRLLHQGLEAAWLQAREDAASPSDSRSLAAAMRALLDVDWWAALLARLHLNAFRVDGVQLLDFSAEQQQQQAGGGLLSTAALDAASGGDGMTSGSALYLLASLFNHACEPSVNVNFPRNDGTAVFTAARPISAGEQLTISYIDAEQEVDVRQSYLRFAYGFVCRCPKCCDELADAAAGGGGAPPPQ